MILAKKYKATISILTLVWMVLFIGLSTSHMGNAHHLFFPNNDITQNLSSQSEQGTHTHCPWTYAAAMTIGSISVPDIQAEITTDKFYATEIHNLRLPNPLALPNTRGPPFL